MSDTQQEIATPQACKQRKRPLLLGIFALIFIILAVVGCVLLSTNMGAVTLILVAFSIIEAIIAIFAVRGRTVYTKIILDILTGGVAIIIINYLLSVLNLNDIASIVATIILISIIVIIAVLLICLKIIKQHKNNEKNVKNTTRGIAYTATFVALSVLFKILGNAISSFVPLPQIKITFTYIPWVFSGIILGPVGGMITAIIGDVIGQILIPTGGAVNPFTVLSNALFPLATALIYKFTKEGFDWLKLLIGISTSLVVCTLGIGAFGIWVMYFKGMSFWTYLFSERIWQAIPVAVNYCLCLSLLPVLKKLNLRKKLRES